MTHAQVLQEALKLPRKERADVAAELLASLDRSNTTSEPDAESFGKVQKAWAVEIERRARKVSAGKSRGIPWEEARREIEQRLEER